MKTLKLNLLISGIVFELLFAATAQIEASPADQQPAPSTRNATNDGSNPAALAAPDVGLSTSTNSTAGGIAAMNFQNVPLQQVLEHLSSAAGFIINSKVPLNGRVTLITPRPLSQQDVVKRLNDALSENGYGSFLQDDGTLRIDTADNIKRAYGPVLKEVDASKIPITEQLVTQVLPIKYVDANQLVQTLRPLLPQGITMHVNSGANSIVVQDTQSHIHRMAEIIKVLDTSLAASAVVKVYTLKFADAKALATVIQNVFQPQANRGSGGVAAAGFAGPGGLGGGGPGGMADMVQAMMAGGGSGGRTGNANQQGRITTPQVATTSDDRANALVVSAAAEQMALIDELVAKLDINIDDLTIVQVFKLNYADPAETVTELSTLFPNTTSGGTQQQQNNFAPGGFQFGGGQGGASGSATAQSDRALKQTQVIAVADSRTGSVIIIASKTLMPEIAKMIAKLDSDKSGEMQMFAFDIESMDPAVAMELLQGLIPAPTGASTTRSTTSSAIFNRSSTGTQGSTGLAASRTGGGGTGGAGVGGGTTGGTGLSDRNSKDNFASVDAREVLAKVAVLPITTWNYKNDTNTLHLGPMAQDFYGAFGIGQDDKTITFLDEGGVALAAVQGLNQKLEDKDAQLQALEKEVSELKALVQSLVTKSGGGVEPRSGN